MIDGLENMVEEIAKRTGLHQVVVRALLAKGWSYTETLNKPATWSSPLANLAKRGRTTEQ